MVASSNYHTMILAQNGTVFACGKNTYGQLGLGDNTDRNTFTELSTLRDGAAETTELPALRDGAAETTAAQAQADAESNIPAKQIAAGSHHTMIVAGDDVYSALFACGSNDDGQLGLGQRNITRTLEYVSNTNIRNTNIRDRTDRDRSDRDRSECVPPNFCNVSGGQLDLGHTNNTNTFH